MARAPSRASHSGLPPADRVPERHAHRLGVAAALARGSSGPTGPPPRPPPPPPPAVQGQQRAGAQGGRRQQRSSPHSCPCGGAEAGGQEAAGRAHPRHPGPGQRGQPQDRPRGLLAQLPAAAGPGGFRGRRRAGAHPAAARGGGARAHGGEGQGAGHGHRAGHHRQVCDQEEGGREGRHLRQRDHRGAGRRDPHADGARAG